MPSPSDMRAMLRKAADKLDGLDSATGDVKALTVVMDAMCDVTTVTTHLGLIRARLETSPAVIAALSEEGTRS